MYDLLANLGLGFSVVFQINYFDFAGFSIPIPMNVIYCLLGALVGTLIGVLPGVGSVATIAVLLPKGSLIKAIAMILAGLLMSMVGADLESGVGRMTFGIPEFSDGIGFVVVAMGVFGFAEIIRNLESSAESREIVHAKITG